MHRPVYNPIPQTTKMSRCRHYDRTKSMLTQPFVSLVNQTTSLQAPAREPKYVKLILDIFHQPDAWRPAATLPALLGCAVHPDTHIQIWGVHVPKNEMLSELPEALRQRRVSLRQRSNHSLHRLQLEVTLVWNIINDYVGLEQKHRQLEKVNSNEAAMFFQECIMD